MDDTLEGGRMLESFQQVLDRGKPLLFDGATGTVLYNKGLFINRCFEEANLSQPWLVEQSHQEYLEAGAQVITTNSWGANPVKLAGHNLHDKVLEINQKSAEIARSCSMNKAYIAGSIGPLGIQIEPLGPTSYEEARKAFATQIKGLLLGGVDCLCLETFSEITEIEQAILAAKELAPDLPIIAQMMISLEGNLPLGTPVTKAIKQLDQAGADVIGLNCSVGPQPMLSSIDKIRSATSKPLIMQPNAGLPKAVDGRKIYMCTPEYMGSFAKKFLHAGVQFIGGCCGTSPEHINAMTQAIRQYKASTTISISKPIPEKIVIDTPQEQRVPFQEKSAWSKKIANNEMVYTVELLPPSGVDLSSLLAKADLIKEAGVDCINIPDGPRASARMSAILTAVMIEQKVGIETILHYTCRDRNLLGMQSDMLGANGIGLRNMLLVTGDPPKMGVYPDATGVFDVDSIGLTNMVNKLNGGIDLGQRPIGEPTRLSIGVGVNPVHHNMPYEMKRFKYKIEAGAEWAITQPIFDVDTFFRFMEIVSSMSLKTPIIAGIWPLTSLRNAEFMNNEVPGIVIPDSIIKKMSQYSDPIDAKKVGVEIAQEMIAKIEGSISGVQVSAPFGRIDMALTAIGKS